MGINIPVVVLLQICDYDVIDSKLTLAKIILGPFIRGKIRRVLHRMRLK